MTTSTALRHPDVRARLAGTPTAVHPEPSDSAQPADTARTREPANRSWESPCGCPEDCLRDHQLD